MKKCLFCHEDIQDAAIRCRHCGADIAAAEAAAQEAKFEKSYSNGSGKFWAVVGTAIFGFLAYGAYAEDLYTDMAICLGFALIFLFFAPKAWNLGFLARNAGQPDIIIASSAGELTKQLFFYEYGARVLLTGGLFLFLCIGLYFLVPLERIVFGPGTQVATSSEVKSSPRLAAVKPPSSAIPVSTPRVDMSAYASAPVKSQDASIAPPVQISSGTRQPHPDMEVASSSNNGSAATTASLPVPVSVPSGIHASFDCDKASSKIEKLICSTPAAADSDARLASAYRLAAAKSSDPAALKQQQRDWLRERNVCDDAACLVKANEARIQALSAM
jgi:uncharacterized protein YecT (DUF1311 family)